MSEQRNRVTQAGRSVQEMLRSAAEWRLLGLLFERPRPEWYDELGRLVRELDHEEIGKVAAAVLRTDEGSYLRVLGHGGVVSPRAVSYRPMEDPGRILADLTGRYQAFHFQSGGEDPADHVATEVGFAGYLALKLAYARSLGDDDKASTALEALRGFVADHLAPFAASLAERLEELQVKHPLAAAARMLADRTAADRVSRSEAGVVSLPLVEGDGFGCAGCD